MRAELRAGEEVMLTQHNKAGGFWSGNAFTVGWYGPGDIGAMDVLFLTPQNIENKKKGSWLPGTFYATNQRLIFEGENVDKNKTITLEDVNSFNLLSYGIEVIEEKGLEHTFRFPEPSTVQTSLEEILHECNIQKAKHCEEVLDYNQAIKLWGKVGKHEDAKRVREMVLKGQGQTIIHGDYVDDRDTTYIDDRDTIVKDSVVSKASIGGGSSKLQEIKELKELHDAGAIDDDEFKQMKQDILGK